MKPIVYIHGAFASSRSFAWLKEKLGDHPIIDVDYSCTDIIKSVDEIEKTIKTFKEVDIIGHSLGGVIGVVLSHRCRNINKVVTLASPFGGSKIAAILQLMTPGSFMRHIQPMSPIMIEARQHVTVPVLSIVTTEGGSALFEKNDGVVTIKSQKAINGANIVELPVNHFEVLLDETTPKLIKEFLW